MVNKKEAEGMRHLKQFNQGRQAAKRICTGSFDTLATLSTANIGHTLPLIVKFPKS